MFNISLASKTARTALAALLLATALAGAFAQKFDSASLSIPVDIESRPVACPLYLKLEMKRTNLPFDTFAAGPKDTAAAMFVTAVEAIRKRDTAKFAGVWTSPEEMKRPDQTTTTVSMVNNSPANWIDVARSNFDFDHLTVVAELLVGSDTMFVWETPTKFGNRRDAFYVGLDRNKQQRLSIASSNAPILALIKAAFDVEAASGHAPAPPSNLTLAYQYRIPLDGPGNPGTHPVYLQFKGAAMDFPVADNAVNPPSPLLAFLRKAARDLRAGRNTAFVNDYTPQSRGRLKPWLDALTQRRNPTQSAFSPTAGLQSALDANVKFVLDAAPVYLVFQSRAPGNSWTAQSLSYSYILRDGTTYKYANFSAQGDLDDFLQSATLFDKTTLKSPPARQPSGTPQLR